MKWKSPTLGGCQDLPGSGCPQRVPGPAPPGPPHPRLLEVPRWQAEVGRSEAAAPAGVTAARPGQSQE